MQLLSGIGFLVLLVASLGVGVRMLALARRTGQAPELLLGLSLVLLAGVGYPLMVATRAPGLLEPPLLGAVAVGGVLAIDVSVALLFAFTWRVFRSGSRLARSAALLAMAATALHFLWAAGPNWAAVSPESLTGRTRLPAILQLLLCVAAYGWSAVEALALHGKLRKRLALGLADPLVCHRTGLWALVSIAAGSAGLVNVFYLAAGVDVLRSDPAQLLTAAAGITQSVGLYLAFLPPRTWADRVRARAAAP
ncbi:MAG: hypothetical protein ACQGVC_04950 [Myxococcota bacterium]